MKKNRTVSIWMYMNLNLQDVSISRDSGYRIYELNRKRILWLKMILGNKASRVAIGINVPHITWEDEHE